MTDGPETERLRAAWADLGVGFAVEPLPGVAADPESLLVATARAAARDPRLALAAIAWLARHHRCIARRRLLRIARRDLEATDLVRLGMMIDLAAHRARQAIAPGVVALARQEARPDAPQPFFDAYLDRPRLVARLGREASEVSRAWGLLAPTLAEDVPLRPASWLFARHPHLRLRADLGGDLRASILAALRADPEAGRSESALARACGATRRGIRLALAKLEAAGRITFQSEGNRKRVVAVA